MILGNKLHEMAAGIISDLAKCESDFRFLLYAFGTCTSEIDFVSLDTMVILILHINKSAKSVRSDRNKMQFLGIITIQILNLMAI